MRHIDLHTHTCFSDAEVTPEYTLKEAANAGLYLLSVSDHNTVAAYPSIKNARGLFHGAILPAVELTTTFKGDVIEILGYGIDTDKMDVLVNRHYLTFYEKQVREARLDTLALLRAGVTLDGEFAETMCNSPEKIFDPSRCTNRPYLLREVKRHEENVKFFESIEEFRTISNQKFTRNYLYNAQSCLYSDQSSLYANLDTVLDIIKECSGLAFLAHPFAYSQNVLSALDDLAGCGIDGIECFYGTFSDKQKKIMCEYCDEKGLYKSGGSDYHGLIMRPQNILGLSDGEKIPFDLIQPWFQKVESSLI